MSNKSYQVRVHSPEDKSAEFFKAIELEYKKLFGWQKKAIKKALNKALSKGGSKGRDSIVRYFSINAPCGSGKTTLLIALAIYDILYSDFAQKQLIIVPQTHIGIGFAKDSELSYICIKLGNKKFQWKILEKHNFCLPVTVRARTIGLKKWLLTSSHELVKDCSDGIISGLNAVCCYASLVNAWKTLTEEEKVIVIHRLSLTVDEAHHLSLVSADESDFETEGERIAANKEATEIGKICSYMMQSGDETAKFRRATATDMRGDRRAILLESAAKQFVSYSYSWAEHFATLGIKNFRFLYEEYKKTPIQQIARNILKEYNERHLIVIPSLNNKWRKYVKKELDMLIDLLVAGGIPREEILDLVTKKTQTKNKEFLLAEPKKNDPNNPPKFRVIIICKLGREGTDWCPCTRIHNGSVESTITLAMQTLGRMLRRYLGKKDIIAITYVKEFTPVGGITSRELLSDRTNALLLCMTIDDSLRPVILTIVPPGEGEERKKRVGIREHLGEIYDTIRQEMLERYEALVLGCDFDDLEEDDIRNMISGILEENEIADNVEVIVNGLFTQLMRVAVDPVGTPVPVLDGIDPVFVRKGGFDKLKKHLSKSIYFGNYTPKDFPVIKNIVEQYFGVLRDMTYEEACKYITEELGLKDMKEYEEWKAKQLRVEANKYEFEKAV